MSASPSTLPPLRRLLAAGMLALVWALSLLAVSPVAHAWLHGDGSAHTRNDAAAHTHDTEAGCVVVYFAQGVTLTEALAAPLGTAYAYRPLFPQPGRLLYLVPEAYRFPRSCGPPSGV